ncbi:Kelch repeat-containing protein [Polaribacter septentrionalilitoris]|uniref:Kelch repeat-containing protein n=1 Tax=Polaribacter septentrionalilitoris TaxID=2494657 RepID=UPI001359D6AF|nr:kelch repeat-containing protein [Polaribacter septentrionalilitoris]
MKITVKLLVVSCLFLLSCQSISISKSEIITTDNLPSARHECGFVEANGLFYLIGGRKIKPVDIFKAKTNTWSQGAKPPIEIHHFQAVTYDDDIYIIGAMTGKYPHEKPLDKILIYQTKHNKWIWGDTIPENRRRGSAGVVVKGDLAYVVCGITDGHWSGHVSWIDTYNFKTGEWKILKDAPRPRDHFHAVIHQNKIYCASGRNSSAKTKQTFNLTISEVDVFDIEKNIWITLPKEANLPTKRAGASSIIKNGQLFVIGGESAAQKMAHNQIEILDLSTNTWQSLIQLKRGRHGTQSILYKNKIYIAAGSGNRGGKPELSSLEIID